VKPPAPQTFMTIGSSGKTIKSGPEDRVFVYFADHGAPGAPALGAARVRAALTLPTHYLAEPAARAAA